MGRAWCLATPHLRSLSCRAGAQGQISEFHTPDITDDLAVVTGDMVPHARVPTSVPPEAPSAGRGAEGSSYRSRARGRVMAAAGRQAGCVRSARNLGQDAGVPREYALYLYI